MKVAFGRYTLDTDARQLVRDGVDVHLSTKAFDLLALLVERRPAVVDKATLRQRLWPGVHVVDASLSNLVAEIRNALDDGAKATFVRTAHGVGYAFSGAVPDPAGSVDSAKAVPFWVVWKDRAIALAPGTNVIGREAACAVWIDATEVSRRHASICIPADGADGNATIEDLGSTNGTYLQGRRLKAPRRLENGDRIRIGSATLVFRSQQGEDAPTKRVRRSR
jgi:DNA-binding winged helix-turn-helix (wHTH) protein